jgi:hypothetical protein
MMIVKERENLEAFPVLLMPMTTRTMRWQRQPRTQQALERVE